MVVNQDFAICKIHFFIHLAHKSAFFHYICIKDNVGKLKIKTFGVKHNNNTQQHVR